MYDILEEATQIVDTTEMHGHITNAIRGKCAQATILNIREDSKPVESIFPVGTRRFYVGFEHINRGAICVHAEVVYVCPDRCVALDLTVSQSMSMGALLRLLTDEQPEQ